MIIAITNQKGGCAKTTTAINLAASLAKLGKRTLLIDLDPQTHASVGLGIKTESLNVSVYNVLSERSDKKQFIENIIQPYQELFDIAPGHVLLSTIEQEFANKDQAVGKLKEALNHMSFPYQFIVIDCPPSLGFLTFNALFAADLAIVPIELGSFAIHGVAKLLSMVELIRVKMNHSPQVYALPTMVDLRTKFSKLMIDKLNSVFSANIFQNYIRTSIAYRESQQLGIPVSMHKRKSKATDDYLNLAKEILRVFNEDSKKSSDSINSDEEQTPQQRVRDFMFQDFEAREVYLVGDFNSWRIDEQNRLWNQGKGAWQKRLVLSPGRYRYKFVVDGKWIPDPNNKLAEPNPYGGMDSVLEVE